MAVSPYSEFIKTLFQDGREPVDLDQFQGALDNVRAGTVGTNLTGVATDPTYRSGFDYARSIAGGMPFEQVVAPGMSFSPDRPMGYTQQDLNFISSGPVPVMPSAPTKGEPLVMEDQMPYAPPGTKEPTIFGQQPTQEVANLFQGIDREALADKIADLNLFNFEDLDFTSFPGFGTGRDFPAPEGSEGPAFVVNPDGTGLMMPPAPPSNMFMPIDVEPKIPVKQPPPVIPNVPVFSPEPEPQLFAQPVSTPVIPTNLVGLPTFTPPVIREPMINIDDIVSPIRIGKKVPSLFGFGPTP